MRSQKSTEPKVKAPTMTDTSSKAKVMVIDPSGVVHRITKAELPHYAKMFRQWG